MIIFDLDGTLWDTTNCVLNASKIVSTYRSDFLPLSKRTVESGMGRTAKENAKRYFPYLEQDKALRYLNELNQTTINFIREHGAKFYDGMQRTIKELARTHRLGIVSNNNDEYVLTFLEKSGLKDCFKDYLGTGSYSMTKAEAIKAMCKMNNQKTNFYVGDTFLDMFATRDAGQVFIHAKYGFEPMMESELFIESISDLPELIKKLEVGFVLPGFEA